MASNSIRDDTEARDTTESEEADQVTPLENTVVQSDDIPYERTRSGAFSISSEADGGAPRPRILSKRYPLRPTIDREQALKLIGDFASRNSTPLNRPNLERFLVINDIKNFTRLCYNLETFIETRKLGMGREPAHRSELGQKQEPPEGVESIFDIPLEPRCEFKRERQEITLSWAVNFCDDCNGRGRVVCSSCSGASYITRADGSTAACPFCMDGTASCSQCLSYGCMKHIDTIEVIFDVQALMRMEPADISIPVSELTKGKATCVFEQMGKGIKRMRKRKDFPDIGILSHACLDLHDKYNQMENTRVLNQRQKLLSIPITLVTAHYKGKQLHVWIYGNDKRVFCQNWSTCSFL